jgi:type IV/VI secretion system ImpK/VasF family protein
MATLFDCFAPVFASGLRVAEEPPARGAAELRRELIGLISEARRCAEAEGKPAADIDRAAFAVVGWLDELIARQADSLTGWTPLQVELFHTNNAGNEFFVYLRELRPDQAEVCEVYYVALCLGFVGEHMFDAGEGGELDRIRRQIEDRLPVPPRLPGKLVETPITPQPYEAPLPSGLRLPRHWERPLLASAVALAVLVPLGLVAYFWWQAPQPTPSAPPVAPTPTPSAPPPRDLQAELARVGDGLECADLDVTTGPDGGVRIAGFVASEEDLSTLRGRLDAIEDLGEVDLNDVAVEPWPFCEVLQITAPLRERNQREQIGLDLGSQPVLYEGEDLVVEIGTPRYPAYLYLDYVQQDGMVGHVAHAAADEPPDQPDDSFPYDTGFEIEAPFGREMMVLIASPEPLFSTLRPDSFERAEAYLPALRQRIQEALAAGPDLPMAAGYVFIRTEPGQRPP